MFLETTLAAVTVLSAAQASTPSPSLSAEAGKIKASGGAAWLAWSVPSAIEGVACCWDGRVKNGEAERGSRRSCSLSGTSFGMNLSTDDGRPSDDELVIYARITPDGVDRVRAVSASCRVDRGSEKVVDLTGVKPAETAAWLRDAALTQPPVGNSQGRGGALMALAMTDESSVDATLERIARESSLRKTREEAAFWLGNTRGRKGYEALVRLRNVADESLRNHLTFAFSQSREPEAVKSLIDMAKADPAPRVRGQALFWLAQKARGQAEMAALREATADPDTEIKKKAVFALSQVPDGEGVPDLIRVARENRNPEVRKQAMFWLGQSKDPRALAFFEAILTK